MWPRLDIPSSDTSEVFLHEGYIMQIFVEKFYLLWNGQQKKKALKKKEKKLVTFETDTASRIFWLKNLIILLWIEVRPRQYVHPVLKATPTRSSGISQGARSEMYLSCFVLEISFGRAPLVLEEASSA